MMLEPVLRLAFRPAAQACRGWPPLLARALGQRQLSGGPCGSGDERDPRDAVVKIFNTRQRPGWTVPWQDQPVESSTGSGAVIEVSPTCRMVLTAAHVVADTRYLQVQRSTDRFSGEKLRASVAAVCHEADLALLLVPNQDALAAIRPLEVAPASKLPRVFDKVRVVGYPVGGDACSITEGVVSRVEVQEYSHSLRPGLALTVDAAINSGNSGGPLVDATTGGIVGVAFQKLVARGVELQGHAVPAPLIQRFLAETAACGVPRPPSGAAVPPPLTLRLPSLGCDYQSLEPPALRRALKLGADRNGILIGRVHHAGDVPVPSLRRGDVLMALNGHEIDELGFCTLLGRRLHFAAARDMCAVGESVPIHVLRDGHDMELNHTLHAANYLVPRGQFDVRPRFFACGGLIFQPLSHEFLQGWSANDRPPHLQNLFNRGHRTPERAEAVMISQVLADEINAGYDSGWIGGPIVQSVNGQRVRDLAHMIEIVSEALSTKEEFLSFEVMTSGGPFRIVLPAQELAEADQRVADLYGMPAIMRSEHYVPTATE